MLCQHCASEVIYFAGTRTNPDDPGGWWLFTCFYCGRQSEFTDQQVQEAGLR